MNDEDYATKEDLWHLEFRISEKLDELEQVREQNSNSLLGAAWGVVPSVNALPAWAAAILLTTLGDPPWWGAALAYLAAMFYSGYCETRAADGQKADRDNLWRISPWKMR